MIRPDQVALEQVGAADLVGGRIVQVDAVAAIAQGRRPIERDTDVVVLDDGPGGAGEQ